MNFKIYIIAILTLVFSGSLKAQFPTDLPQSTSGFPTGSNPNNTFPQKDKKTDKSSNGRISLDDSTRVVYGPTSTRYFLEEDIVNNRKRLYNIDTTLDGIHNYNFVQRNKSLYQDLGNIGSAIRPIFYKAPEQIGTLLGYDAYTLYNIKPSEVRYYNTKSPFSNIIYIPGGGDQDFLQFELSRNVDSLWNVGINVQRISANKTLVDQTTTGDNTAISHWDFTIHSNYQTKNKKYSFLGFVNLSDRNINDQGGVILESGKDYAGMLALDGNKPLLTTAASRDKSYNLHLYHEYVGYKAFQVYQTIDLQTRKVQFADKSSTANTFYPDAFLNSNVISKNIYSPGKVYVRNIFKADSLYYVLSPQTDSIYNETRYSLFQHKTGIKGFYKGFNYRLHIRQRFFSYQNPFNSYRNEPVNNTNISSVQLYKYTQDTAKTYHGFENFVGLWLNQYFKDSTRFFGEFEYLLGKKDIRVNGEYQGKWLNVGGSFLSAPPTLIQQAYFSNGLRWDQTNLSFPFKNVVSINVFGYTHLKYKQIMVHPSINIDNISDYIYFDKDAVAKQNNKDIRVFRAGLGVDYRWRKFSTTNQIYVSFKTDSLDVMRIPKTFINSRIAVDLLFRKKLFIQTGLDINYQSEYNGNAYMPVTQQFHLQDKQAIQGYAQVDVFADMRINRVRLFFKFAHANYRLPLMGNGYYASPGFAGMGRVLAFGVHWLLFD